jgi:hypothetical protein
VGKSRFRHVGVVAANEGARFPGRAGPKVAALEDDNISHTALGELKCGRQAVDASTNDHDFSTAWQTPMVFAVDYAVRIRVAGHRNKSLSLIQPLLPSCEAAS